MTEFQDRRHAGKVLASRLTEYTGRADVIVLALPRGGVPVAYEVAKALKAPLDLFVVRKLGVPWQEELAMGAVAPGGIRVLNEDVITALNIPPEVIEAVAAREEKVALQNRIRFSGDRPPPDLKDRIVILIDDGLATGATARAAVEAIRSQEPAQIVLAVPVADRGICDGLRSEVDEIICASTPRALVAVGLHYEDFTQTTDEEVRSLLEASRLQQEAPQPVVAAA
jgi:putative phosphoribosyl transferase